MFRSIAAVAPAVQVGGFGAGRDESLVPLRDRVLGEYSRGPGGDESYDQ